MHCPRCGDELKIFEESKGYRWLYRMYPCQRCKVIWNLALRMFNLRTTEDRYYWKLEECRAWKAVGIPILEEAEAKRQGGNS